MGSTRRRFTDEYKARAVELAINDDRTIADVARSIGVHEMTLGRWVEKSKDEDQGSGRPLGEDERALMHQVIRATASAWLVWRCSMPGARALPKDMRVKP